MVHRLSYLDCHDTRALLSTIRETLIGNRLLVRSDEQVKYLYEDLGDDQFEELVVFLCQRLFGIGLIGFSTGPDGGRDAKFVGVADLFPSKTAPWSGTTIVQSKHTNGHNKSFSESDFFGSGTSVIAKEIPRIKALRAAGQLDQYLIVANRRLSAGTETLIRAHIATECGIPESSIALIGVEQLEILLKQFPGVATLARLDPIDSPLIVSPDELANIVEAFGRQRESIIQVIDDPPTVRVAHAAKNTANNMTEEYARELRRRYLKDTPEIRAFIAAPENEDLLRMYESVVAEFQLRIISKRHDYQTFDEVMEYIIDLLFDRDPVLRQLRNKRLTRSVLFYMYWNCDIGLPNDSATN